MALTANHNLLINRHSLQYTVHDWSSFSANYHPNNVLEDKPSSQASRWSSDTNYPPQFITLKLSKPSIVTDMTFGKYEKMHVCNLRKFMVYGGLNQEHMMELLSDGLKNDSNKETFALRHELKGKMFPCLFVKIVPIESWGPSFNFSIWHVSMRGVDDYETIRPCLKWYNDFREQEVIRLCLKHFRQRNYMEAFDALQRKTQISLEHPALTELHQVLVKHGHFEQAETIIHQAANENLFNEYIYNQAYVPKWMPIIALNENGMESMNQPGMRGGHQMVLDTDQQMIYIFGGWDGSKDLSDLWVFSIQHEQWHLISKDTSEDGGPSGRSCHKMCMDTKRRDLYVLGRYLDAEARAAQLELTSDFFKYDLDTGQWSRISSDTADEGGPNLIFDHQMVFDGKSDSLYVFGGRILTSTVMGDEPINLEPQFSGLFAYHIPTNTWEKIREDENTESSHGSFSCKNVPDESWGLMKSRIGHSMLFDEKDRLLYIFAGQRGKVNLSDFFTFDLETGEVKDIVPDTDNDQLPSSGFTQRSTIDTELGEIYVLSGLSKDKEKKEDTIRNSFWVYHLKRCKWVCVYRNENHNQQYWNKMQNVEPCPRFAHQLVYDQRNKVHYLFGGNPGKSLGKMRLDDFWKLKLERPSLRDVIRNCKFMIRKLRYREMAETNAIEALPYLQNEVSELIDHTNHAERQEFESLATSLFVQQDSSSSNEEDVDRMTCAQGDFEISSHLHKRRTEVFDQIVRYFPSDMTHPCGDLVDLISLS